MIRSVGIPARIMDQFHTASHCEIQVYDADEKRWALWDCEDAGGGETAITSHLGVTSYGMYVLPPYMSADMLGKQMFDKVQTAEFYTQPNGRVTVTVRDKGSTVSNAWVAAYVWSFYVRNWHPFFKSKTNAAGRTNFGLGNNLNIPFMISAGKGDRSAIIFCYARPGEDQSFTVDLSQPRTDMSVNVKATRHLSSTYE